MKQRIIIGIVSLFMIVSVLPTPTLAWDELVITGDYYIDSELTGPGHLIIIENIDAAETWEVETDVNGNYEVDIGQESSIGDLLRVHAFEEDHLYACEIEFFIRDSHFQFGVIDLDMFALGLTEAEDEDNFDLIYARSRNLVFTYYPKTPWSTHEYEGNDFWVTVRIKYILDEVDVIGPETDWYDLISGWTYHAYENYDIKVWQGRLDENKAVDIGTLTEYDFDFYFQDGDSAPIDPPIKSFVPCGEIKDDIGWVKVWPSPYEGYAHLYVSVEWHAEVWHVQSGLDYERVWDFDYNWTVPFFCQPL